MAAPYPRQRRNTWYLASWPYRIFMLRELSAVFLALYTALLLVVVTSVHDGPAAFADTVATLKTPAFIVIHVVAMAFALLHSATWFQAVPKGLPIRRGEQPVPAPLIIGANYVLLLAVTVAVVVIVRL